MTDITEYPAREGGVHCAVVLDACSRRVVGRSIDAAPTAALVTALFEYLAIFHNRQRRHSSLGMLTPTELEVRREAAATSTPA